MIKFIYFDVGGVLIRDFNKSNKWQELLSEIGISKENEDNFLKLWKKYEPAVCTGFEVDLLIPVIEKEFKIKIPNNYSLLKDGFIARFERNETIWPLVEKLKKTYKVGLLTNQYPRMYDLLIKKRLLSGISWDVVIDSVVVKFRKPQPEIYKLAEKEAGYSGNEIFFIDNLQEHLDGAKLFDWQTFLYDPSNFQISTLKLSKIFNIIIKNG